MMKRQFSLLLSGVAGVMLFVTVVPVQAYSLDLIQKTSEQPSLVKGGNGSPFSAVENLNLSAAQQQEIEAIKASVENQLASILTPSQLQTFRTAMANGGNMQSVVRSLGLSRNQMSSLRSTMTSIQGDIMAVLTPEQRSQLERTRPRNR